MGSFAAITRRVRLSSIQAAIRERFPGEVGGQNAAAAGEAHADKFEDPHFLDLDWPAIDRELARAKEKRRSGPVAENILRDLGLVGHKVH